LVGQWILADDGLRAEFPLNNWYGTEYAVDASNTDIGLWGNIVLEIEEYTTLPFLTVYINGEAAGKFDTSRLTLKVFPGDVVAIDSSAYAAPITVRLVSCSASIDTSLLLMHVRLMRERAELGTIIFK